MNTYSLDLLFLSRKKRELEYKFGPPSSHITLKSWTCIDRKGVPKDLPLLTPDCITIGELEYQVERLHEELEEIRKAAKAKYAKYYGRAVQMEQESKKWTPKPKRRSRRIFAPPGGYYSIEPPRVTYEGLDRSWSLDQGKETIGGISAKACGLGSVVTARSPKLFRQAVEQMAYYFRREFGYDFVQYSSEEKDDGHRAYLWVLPETLENGKVKAVGACCFRWREWEDAPASYALQWIWLHPHERRKGRLTQAWPYFQERFGKFIPEPPLSPAMKRFLLKRLDPAVFSEAEKQNEARFESVFKRYLKEVRDANANKGE